MSNSRNLNSVFYAETYHPIQAGSIDGTDIVTHDNAIYRALLCSNASLYDPFGDPKVKGDPYCTLFVTRLSHSTTEDILLKAMNKYGRVKNLRLVRHIVTGASRGYAFVEFETEKEMRRAYKEAHHTYIDDSEILVDYNRQNLMPGWIPRRLGGGLGGKKESGQIRFGGRERPFKAPLRPIPWDDLKRLGIPPPPEGRYMSRHEVPSPPRRKRGTSVNEEYMERRVEKSLSPDRSFGRKRSRYSEESRERKFEKSPSPDPSSGRKRSRYTEEWGYKERREGRDSYRYEKKRSSLKEESEERISMEKEERSSRHHRSSHRYDRWRSNSRDRYE